MYILKEKTLTEEKMKNRLLALLLGILIILFSANEIWAKPQRPYPSRNYLDFSWFFKPTSLGLKARVFSHFYLTGNLDYRESVDDLEFHAGAVYMFPVKILIFRLYAGGGYQFSRNYGYQYPYVTVGTHFMFLFSEVVYPMETAVDPKYRFGLSIKF
jgi:hypothetical protein